MHAEFAWESPRQRRRAKSRMNSNGKCGTIEFEKWKFIPQRHSSPRVHFMQMKRQLSLTRRQFPKIFSSLLSVIRCEMCSDADERARAGDKYRFRLAHACKLSLRTRKLQIKRFEIENFRGFSRASFSLISSSQRILPPLSSEMHHQNQWSTEKPMSVHAKHTVCFSLARASATHSTHVKKINSPSNSLSSQSTVKSQTLNSRDANRREN